MRPLPNRKTSAASNRVGEGSWPGQEQTDRGQGLSAIALVFDRLSPDGRARATQAALSYLQESAKQDELFGVFFTDLSVLVLQPFTDNRALVKFGNREGKFAKSFTIRLDQREGAGGQRKGRSGRLLRRPCQIGIGHA